MLYGGAYGRVTYGGRLSSTFVQTETTIVSGTPSAILGTISETLILPSAATEAVLRTRNVRAELTTKPGDVILPSNPGAEDTLL